MKNQGYGRAPGAAGELLQGQLSPGKNFLISLPINLWSEARFTPNIETPQITISDPAKIKTLQAVQYLLEFLDMRTIGGHIEITSNVPMGKGMASSTADITAACRAVGDALNNPIPPETIAAIAGRIEPSDGVMFPGLVSFDHTRCELVEALGDVPQIDVLIVDLGGTVDTLAFNQQPKNYTAADLSSFQQAYQMVKQGIEDQNFALLGEGGLISARVNQKMQTKRNFETIASIGMEQGALGVCVGHSGTIINLLFKPGSSGIHSTYSLLQEKFNQKYKLHITSTTNELKVEGIT